MNSFSENNKVVNKNKEFSVRSTPELLSLLEKNGIDMVKLFRIRKILLYNKKRNTTLYQFMNSLLGTTFHKRFEGFYPSTKRLGKRYDRHEKTISRSTGKAKRLDLIEKVYRGYNKTVEYRLSDFLKNPLVQYYLHDLFPYMRFKAREFHEQFDEYMEKKLNPFKSFFYMVGVTLYKHVSDLNIINYRKRDNCDPNSSQKIKDDQNRYNCVVSTTNLFQNLPDLLAGIKISMPEERPKSRMSNEEFIENYHKEQKNRFKNAHDVATLLEMKKHLKVII